MENKDIAKIFKALCDENRIAIIKILQNGEKCACDLSEKLNLSQSKLSYHMKILSESKIINCRFVGKWCYYKIDGVGSQQAIDILKELTTFIDNEANCN